MPKMPEQLSPLLCFNWLRRCLPSGKKASNPDEQLLLTAHFQEQGQEQDKNNGSALDNLNFGASVGVGRGSGEDEDLLHKDRDYRALGFEEARPCRIL